MIRPKKQNVIEGETSGKRDSQSGYGNMVLEVAKERVFLKHQMFEEKWDIFDSQGENTSDCDETGSDSSADECSVSE